MRIGAINTQYELGTLVYLRAAPEVAGMITSLTLLLGGGFFYTVFWGNERGQQDHFEQELTDERPL